MSPGVRHGCLPAIYEISTPCTVAHVLVILPASTSALDLVSFVCARASIEQIMSLCRRVGTCNIETGLERIQHKSVLRARGGVAKFAVASGRVSVARARLCVRVL